MKGWPGERSEMQKVQEEEALEAKTTQRLAQLRLGSTTLITAGHCTDHRGPTVFTEPNSACGTMKKRSSSTSSLQQPTFDIEEPRNKKILVDPSSFSLAGNAAGAPPNNSTVTAPPQPQPELQFSAHSYTNSVSGPLHFNFSATHATTTQGQGTNLRRCYSGPIAPRENTDDFNFFRAPAAPPSTLASSLRSESFLSPQPEEKNHHLAETEKTPPPKPPAALQSSKLLPSFSGTSNTAMTSPEATLPLPRPSPPCPAPVSVPPTTRTTEKTGMSPMAEPKDSSRSSESAQAGVCGVSLPESPAEKRLNRMKKHIQEMHEWWNEVIQEDEAEIFAEDRAISTNVRNLSSLEDEAEISAEDRAISTNAQNLTSLEDEAEISAEDRAISTNAQNLTSLEDEAEIYAEDREDEAEISAEDRAKSTNVQNLRSSEEAVIPRGEREAVRVEREGRGFRICIWCNCGCRYEVLL